MLIPPWRRRDALLERQVLDRLRGQEPCGAGQIPKAQSIETSKKAAEVEQVRSLMKAGSLSQGPNPLNGGRFAR